MHEEALGAVGEQVLVVGARARRGVVDLRDESGLVRDLRVQHRTVALEPLPRRERLRESRLETLQRVADFRAVQSVHDPGGPGSGEHVVGQELRESPRGRERGELERKERVQVGDREPARARRLEPCEDREEAHRFIEIGKLGEAPRQSVVMRVQERDGVFRPRRLGCGRAGLAHALRRGGHADFAEREHVSFRGEGEIDVVRVKPESGLLIDDGARRRIGRESLQMSPEPGNRAANRLAHVPVSQQVDPHAERLEPDVGQEADHPERGVAQPPSVVDDRQVRRRRPVEAHVRLAVASARHGPVGDRQIGEREGPAQDGRFRLRLAREPADAAGRLEARALDPQASIEDRLQLGEIERWTIPRRSRVGDRRSPRGDAELEGALGEEVPVRMHLDFERGNVAAAAMGEAAALARQRVPEHGPRFAPRFLRCLDGIFARRGRENRAELPLAVALEDEAPRTHHLHPRRLRLPGLPQRAHLHHRWVGGRRQRIQGVDQNKGVRLEERIEEAVRERVVTGAQALQQDADRLPRMRQPPPVHQSAIFDANPPGGLGLGDRPGCAQDRESEDAGQHDYEPPGRGRNVHLGDMVP